MRRLIVLICAIVVLIVSLVFISYVTPLKHQENSQNRLDPSSTLYFSPGVIISLCNNDLNKSLIYLSSKSNPVSSVQIELFYDPNVIHNLSIAPVTNGLFGTDFTVQLEEVREEYGRASLALQLKPEQSEKSGNKPIAQVTFNVLPYSATNSSSISFVEKSTVMSGESERSLLEETSPLKIYCVNNNRTPSTPPSLIP